MKLAYVAFNRAGKQVSDTVDATGVAAATEMLRRQGLYVTRIAPGNAAGRPGAAKPARCSKSRRLRYLVMLTRQLHALVSCGTPVVQALQSLEQQTKKGPWRDAIADIRARVEEGAPLSISMDAHPEFFDPISRCLVAAGESSGNLASMLDRIATVARKDLHIRSTIIGMMVYPTLLLTVAVSVLTLLLVLVVPRFGELFGTLNVPLPPTTEALLVLSHLLQAYWWAVILLVVGPVVGLWLWMARPSGQRVRDTVVLRLPQIGRMARSLATARIARLLGVLLESHIGILDALELTRESAGNSHYAALIDDARDAITRGKPMSSAFAESDLISPSVCEAIRSGEQSGQVGPLLLNIADFLDEENEVVVRSLTSIIEPVILVLMGVLVGTVAISMFLPLFDLTSMTQGAG